MRRWLRWLLPLLAVGLIVAVVVRTIEARRVAQAQATAPKPATGLDLAAADVVVARTRDAAAHARRLGRPEGGEQRHRQGPASPPR